MTVSVDVLIVGAGIVGAACAWELAKARLRVAIVDQSFPAAGATGAAMGHIVVMDDSQAQFALTRYSQTLWEELLEDLPASIEFDLCGTIWVAADEEELAEVRRKAAYYRERGVRTEILDSRALQEAEPSLRAPLAGGLLVPGDSVVYPPAAAAYFLERAAALGATLHAGKSVTKLGEGSACLEDGTIFHAGKLINACGQLAPKLTPGIPVKPRKGHLVITDRYPGMVRHQLVEMGYLKSAHSVTSDSVAFNVQPRKTAQLLIGSSRQYDVAHDKVEPEILSRMLKRAFEYVPKLSTLSGIRVWTGFRPATPDKLPLIGPWLEDPTLYLATGHEGLGITTSLATARLISAQILDTVPAISMDPYLPSRNMAAEIHA
ncbi:MAG TPA: FAD-dependent oxidoreductase [Candidatus Acidoferrum sp.]|nr:FAD-dependent oxidoreductase [Candidatus Acidoferrum sp.]